MEARCRPADIRSRGRRRLDTGQNLTLRCFGPASGALSAVPNSPPLARARGRLQLHRGHSQSLACLLGGLAVCSATICRSSSWFEDVGDVSKDLRGKGAYRDSVLTRLCLLLPSSTPRSFSAAACSQMSADASLSRLLLVEADNSKHSKRTWRNHFEMSLELQPGGRPVDNDHARLPNFAQLCRVPATEVSILRRVGSSAVYEEQAFSWSGYPYPVKDVRVGISPDGARFLCLRLHALDGPVPTPRLGATEAQLSELELLSGKLLSYLHGRAYRVSVCLQGTAHPSGLGSRCSILRGNAEGRSM